MAPAGGRGAVEAGHNSTVLFPATLGHVLVLPRQSAWVEYETGLEAGLEKGHVQSPPGEIDGKQGLQETGLGTEAHLWVPRPESS